MEIYSPDLLLYFVLIPCRMKLKPQVRLNGFRLYFLHV